MTTKTISRLVRLGAACKLTRAGTQGEFIELNPVERYDITVGCLTGRPRLRGGPDARRAPTAATILGVSCQHGEW